MKRLNKNLIIAIISILVFALFIIVFYVTCYMIESGSISNIELSQAVQAILVFVMFFPLLAALFFGGKFIEEKGHYKIARIAKFVSIALFIFSVFQVLLSLLGVYN